MPAPRGRGRACVLDGSRRHRQDAPRALAIGVELLDAFTDDVSSSTSLLVDAG